MKKFALGKGDKYRITFNNGKTLVYRIDGTRIFERELCDVLGTESHIGYGNEVVKLNGQNYIRRTNCTLEII